VGRRCRPTRGVGHLDGNRRGIAAPVNHLETGDRHQHESVERLPKHAALARVDPHYFELLAEDPDRAANGINRLKELVGDFRADDHDRSAFLDVEIRERSSRQNPVVLHGLVRRGHPEDDRVT
jgi:hypothetical protein